MIFKVFYTNWCIQSKFTAQTYGPFIFIRPRAINNVGLLEHEKIHVKQFWHSWGLFGLAYWLSKPARLRYELEAYRKQLEYNPELIDAFALALSSKYGLDLSESDAKALLIGP